MDLNKQANVVANFDDDSYEILKSFDSTKFNLRQNCRNTKQIVRQAEQYTGATDRDTLAKNVDILVATPGRLFEHIEKESFDWRGMEVMNWDEADRMLDMGLSGIVTQIGR